MSTPKVSIVIPVYNAGKYIEQCAHSLFNQTLDDIEYLFVDDHSSDNSIDLVQNVLLEYRNRKDQVKIIKNPINLGVGQTRQIGIDNATGEYIIHCDPDDWVASNMYESLYKKAIDTDADIVVCNFVEEATNRTRISKQVLPANAKELFSCIRTGKLHMAFWNKLLKIDLAKKYTIQPGLSLWEDMSVVPLFFLDAKIIAQIDSALYHYRVSNAGSIVNSPSLKRTESSINAITYLKQMLIRMGIINQINSEDFAFLQICAKRGLLDRCDYKLFNRWRHTFEESNSMISCLDLPFRSRVLMWTAVNNVYPIFSLFCALSKIKKLIR